MLVAHKDYNILSVEDFSQEEGHTAEEVIYAGSYDEAWWGGINSAPGLPNHGN